MFYLYAATGEKDWSRGCDILAPHKSNCRDRLRSAATTSVINPMPTPVNVTIHCKQCSNEFGKLGQHTNREGENLRYNHRQVTGIEFNGTIGNCNLCGEQVATLDGADILIEAARVKAIVTILERGNFLENSCNGQAERH